MSGLRRPVLLDGSRDPTPPRRPQVAWIAWAVSALVGLALRGAIAAAYLRLTS